MNPHSHQRKRPPPGNRKGLNAVVNQQNTPYDQFDYQATNRIQSPPPVYVAGDFEDRPCHGHSAQELSVSEVSPSVGGWGTTHTQQPSDSVAHHPPWNSIWTPDYGVLSSYQIPPREVQLPPLDQALGEAWRQRDPFAEGIEETMSPMPAQVLAAGPRRVQNYPYATGPQPYVAPVSRVSREIYHNRDNSMRRGPRMITSLLHPNSRRNHVPESSHCRSGSSLSREWMQDPPLRDLEEPPQNVSTLMADAPLFYPGQIQHGLYPLPAPSAYGSQGQCGPPLMAGASSVYGAQPQYGPSVLSGALPAYDAQSYDDSPQENRVSQPETPRKFDGGYDYDEWDKYSERSADYSGDYSGRYSGDYSDHHSDSYTDDSVYYCPANVRARGSGSRNEHRRRRNNILFTMPGMPTGCSALLVVGAIPDTPFWEYPGTVGVIRALAPDVETSRSDFHQGESQAESLRRAQVTANDIHIGDRNAERAQQMEAREAPKSVPVTW